VFCVFIVYIRFCFVTLADESDMKKALSLSGGSVKGSTLSIEVSKKPPQGGKAPNFTSPRGAGHQVGTNRGES